jgi:MoaA/NifB/PqqE/SkfB family radical SAM enzyme
MSEIKPRHLVPPNKCFYTWDIHYACNYRCSYCYFCNSWEDEAKKNRYPGIEKWKKIWDDIFAKYGTGHIHISGGEPFAYPDIYEITEHLIKNFTVEYDTNLSWDVDKFMAKIPPDRVKFAISYHPQFAEFEEYIDKIKKLKDAGYDLGVNYVAHPTQLEKMAYYKQRLDEIHVSFDVMPFRGQYESKEYPKSYNEKEKELMTSLDKNTAGRMLEAYAPEEKAPEPKQAEQKAETQPQPTENTDSTAHYANTNKHYKKFCRMGQMYTKIHPNGNAYRCCLIKEEGLIGNLIDGTFKFYEDPQPCVYDKCPCWVAMIDNEEQNWLFHWQTPKVRPHLK